MMTSAIDVDVLLELWRVAETSARHVDCTLNELRERSRAQFFVMRVLASADQACAPSEIARELRCSKANVGPLVRRLEECGYVEKQRDDRDTRAVCLSLTSRGTVAYADCEAQLADDARRVLEPLDASEREQLLGMLRKLMISGF